MEISTSSMIGATRVGLQVVSSTSLPNLEFYYTFHNRINPPDTRIHETRSGPKHGPSYGHRSSDQFVQFSLVNIGGQRAENIDLVGKSSFKIRNEEIEFGGLFHEPISQIPPGQVHHLFRIDSHDLFVARSNNEILTGTITLTAEYDLQKSLINNIKSKFLRQGSGRNLKTVFKFKPIMVNGWLPPAEFL